MAYRLLNTGMLSLSCVQLEDKGMAQLSLKRKPRNVPAAPFICSRWLDFHDPRPSDTQQKVLVNTVKMMYTSTEHHKRMPGRIPFTSLRSTASLTAARVQHLECDSWGVPVNLTNPCSGSCGPLMCA